MKKHIEVVAAIFINDQNYVFCTRRKNFGELALKWEFPGGKIDLEESPQEALKREIKEELEINIVDLEHYITTNHEYNSFTITLHAYICEGILDNYVLNDHEESKWVHRNDLLILDWTEADLPIVAKLMGVLK